jgi:ADP-heptose:LPS heptosyltransferase
MTKSLFSLQVGAEEGALHDIGNEMTDTAPFLTDFAETAVAMANLDLVIGVDTSVVHVTGALGRPV